MLWFSACAVVMCAAAACSKSVNDDLLDELQALNFGKYLTEPEFHPTITQQGEWEVYTYPVDELRCVSGGEYFIMARPGSDAGSTVIWLEGGGACWPGQEDCLTEARFSDWIEAQGLASSRSVNPVRDWNFVYVPYCDGSLHAGDNQADYDGDGEVDHWHWGLRSTSAAVRLMADLFPDSERVLIAGCSAGGGGTLWAAPVVRMQFPEAKLYVLSMAGLALVDPAQPEAFLTIEETWNVGQFIPQDCPQCRQQFIHFFAWLLERDTNLRVGVFSSLEDRAARGRWGMGPQEFRSLMLETTGEIYAAHPDAFQRFFIEGEVHCPSRYNYRLEGTSLWQWIGYLVNEDDRWVDLVE